MPCHYFHTAKFAQHSRFLAEFADLAKFANTLRLRKRIKKPLFFAVFH